MSMLWQRFTERAKRTVIAAQEEAAQGGEPYVSPEHLLLGLVNENDSVAANVLERLGVAATHVRQEIERQIGSRGYGRLNNNDVSLDPRMKRVLDFAYDEALQMHINYIGTEHLLLGVIREGDGIGFGILAKMGVDLVTARKEVAKYLGTGDVPPDGSNAQTPRKRVDHKVETFTDPAKAKEWLDKVVNEGYEVSKVAAATGEIWIIATATMISPATSTNAEPDDVAIPDDATAADDASTREPMDNESGENEG